MRKVIVVALVVLVLPVSGVFAQGDPPVFCGELAEADCVLLVESQQAMMTIDSLAFDLGMSLEMTDPESAGMLAMAFNAYGAVAVDAAALANFTGDAEMAPEDMMEMDFAEMMDLISVAMADVLRAVAGDINLELVLPEGATLDAAMPDDLALHLLMTDGVAYVDLSTLMPAGSGDAMSSWFGLDLAAMYETLPGMMEAFEMDDLQGGMGDLGEMDAIFATDYFALVQDPAFWTDYLTIERQADAEVSGQPVAVFTTTFDYTSLVSDERFMAAMQDYMMTVIEMQETAGADMPEDFTEMFFPLMDTMMQYMRVEVVQTEWIGLDDAYLHHTAFVMSLEADFAGLEAALQELLPEEDIEMGDAPDTFWVAVDVSLDLSAFNEPVEVAAPEGAQVINPFLLLMQPGGESATF